MKRGRSEAETCALNGWRVGAVVRGFEAWGNDTGVWTTWQITAIGESSVLAKTLRSDFVNAGPPNTKGYPEHTVTFQARDWTEVPSPTNDSPRERAGETNEEA